MQLPAPARVSPLPSVRSSPEFWLWPAPQFWHWPPHRAGGRTNYLCIRPSPSQRVLLFRIRFYFLPPRPRPSSPKLHNTAFILTLLPLPGNTGDVHDVFVELVPEELPAPPLPPRPEELPAPMPYASANVPPANVPPANVPGANVPPANVELAPANVELVPETLPASGRQRATRHSTTGVVWNQSFLLLSPGAASSFFLCPRRLTSFDC